MTSSGFYFVFIRDGIAKVLPESDFDDFQVFENAGWKMVWDSARSEEDGQAYAAKFHKSIDADFTDGMKPSLMDGPKVLYRSVSIPELLDIVGRGSISGKGNSFNEFDDRSLVFFCDSLSPSLMAQGEDLQRQAATALAEEPIHFDFGRLQAEKNALIDKFKGIFEAELALCDQRIVKMGGQAAVVNPGLIEQLDRGSLLAVRQLARLVRPRSETLTSIGDQIQSIDNSIAVLRAEYKNMENEWLEAESERRESYPFTSVVIQTAPISHGYHYSSGFGKSGMGEEDEYGFMRDSVSVLDIARVHCIKDGRIVRKVEPQDIALLAEEIEMSASPAMQMAN